MATTIAPAGLTTVHVNGQRLKVEDDGTVSVPDAYAAESVKAELTYGTMSVLKCGLEVLSPGRRFLSARTARDLRSRGIPLRCSVQVRQDQVAADGGAGVIKRDDAEGLEYDWLAVDSEGFVALFSTAGAGFAPAELLRDPEGFDAAIDALLRMPARTAVDCGRDLPAGRVNTWRLVAERGLFAFDSDALGGPYQIIARPQVPVRATDLPTAVSSVAGRIVLPAVSFKVANEIAEEQIPH